MSVAVIITAAGSGTRLGADLPKALVRLAGEPILVHSLRAACASSVIDHTVVTAPAGHLPAFRALAAPFGAVVVPGGDTRQASVAAGLAALPDDVDVVLVHDAARALTPPSLFVDVVDGVRNGRRAVVPALPVVDTVKSVDPGGSGGFERVNATVDRAALRAVQTPQGFERALLERAHGAAPLDSASDDAGLVEALGDDVWLIPGSESALKITTPWDLGLAAFLTGSPS